jgi:hypothetical protein
MIHYMSAKKSSGSKPRRTRTGPKADWLHAGADIEPGLYRRLIKEAERNGVPYAVVLRWALDEYLPAEGEE